VLFSNPRLVADLLTGFIEEPWVGDLDLTTLRRFNAKLHADNLERRDGDMIWRVRLKSGGQSFIYLVLEFQSRPDRWMALRIGTYVLLLYLHLIREGKVGSDGLLPPVFPLVLYNGDIRWNSPVELADLIAPVPGHGPWPWRPSLRYHVISEQFLEADDGPGGNICAVLFAMERCRTVAELKLEIDRLVGLLTGEEHAALSRAFTTWLRSVVAPARGLSIGQGHVKDLLEYRSMLKDIWENSMREAELKIQRQFEQKAAERFLAGRQEGRQEGLARGIAEGRAQTLLRQLRLRFGDLPTDVVQRVSEANIDELDQWTERVLDAGSLDDVLNGKLMQ